MSENYNKEDVGTPTTAKAQGSPDGVLIIPEGVQFLRRDDVTDRESIREIHLPKSLVNITEGAFEGCTALTTVHAKGYLYGIKERAFAGCTSLTEVHLGGLLEIGRYAFSSCSSLRRIVIGSSSDVTLSPYIFDKINGEFTVEFGGTREQFERMTKVVVGKKAVGWSGDYHHPSSSHFEELTANIYASAFSVSSGEFICTVACRDGESEYRSCAYSEWVD